MIPAIEEPVGHLDTVESFWINDFCYVDSYVDSLYPKKIL